MLHHRLARDYETLATNSEAVIHLAMIDNVSKRVTDDTTPTWRGIYQDEKCLSNAHQERQPESSPTNPTPPSLQPR